MSSNIPLMNPTEDKIQDKYMAQNKVPSLDKSGSASKTETEHTEKLDTKKRSLLLASSYDKNIAGQEPKDITIKTNKSAHDDQSCSSMSASQDLGRIPRKKNKKVSETSITGNKITQDQENMSKEAKVGSSIEGKKSITIESTSI